jgi:hypothetical protein
MLPALPIVVNRQPSSICSENHPTSLTTSQGDVGWRPAAPRRRTPWSIFQQPLRKCPKYVLASEIHPDQRRPRGLSKANSMSSLTIWAYVMIKAFQVLGCEGLARIDTFVTPDGAVYVNEPNTMPGFTRSSGFPLMWWNALIATFCTRLRVASSRFA